MSNHLLDICLMVEINDGDNALIVAAETRAP
jgi:hypothetical protein